ncbi:phosphatase PAP2 family protein [Paenibacillus sp. XY044]|nr:phosphatase PAP2 family protein [Paenibacillus sp. XY044]
MERAHGWDRRVFHWINRIQNPSLLNAALRTLTHLGGALFTITLTLSVALFAPEPWRTTSLQSLAALALSFLITTLIKRKVRRIRPYLALEGVRVGKNPLKDPSFPSGHSTAIFSIITPFLFMGSWVAVSLILIALIVSISRIYLGLHYPSDCLVGSFVGSMTGVLTIAMISL